LLDSPSSTVTIRPNGEHRVDWRVQANAVGKLTLLAKALTDTESDAVEMTMDIVPHGLKRTTGNTMTVTQKDADQTISLDVPGRTDTQARSLRIEVSPSIAGALFGALDYLTSYPYGCTEQTMSSFLPNIVVAQTLKTFQQQRFARRTISITKFEKVWIGCMRISMRRRLGLVERRQERSVYDGLRRGWSNDGESGRLSG
jgi:uncharacterized protein YfaS (alpha-2-macroglobulin family)